MIDASTLTPGDMVVIKPSYETPFADETDTLEIYDNCLEAHTKYVLLVIAIDETRMHTNFFVHVFGVECSVGWIEMLSSEIIEKM